MKSVTRISCSPAWSIKLKLSTNISNVQTQRTSNGQKCNIQALSRFQMQSTVSNYYSRKSAIRTRNRDGVRIVNWDLFRTWFTYFVNYAGLLAKQIASFGMNDVYQRGEMYKSRAHNSGRTFRNCERARHGEFVAMRLYPLRSNYRTNYISRS